MDGRITRKPWKCQSVATAEGSDNVTYQDLLETIGLLPKSRLAPKDERIKARFDLPEVKVHLNVRRR